MQDAHFERVLASISPYAPSLRCVLHDSTLLYSDVERVLRRASDAPVPKAHLEQISRAIFGDNVVLIQQQDDNSDRSFPALAELCHYDNKNGTVYGLVWASVLNGLATSAITSVQRNRTTWLLLADIGSQVLLQRYPKDFSQGVHPECLDIVLLLRQATVMIAPPIVIATASDLLQIGTPEYVWATEQISQFALGKLVVLRNSQTDNHAKALYRDLLNWSHNSSLQGRAGCSAARVKAMPSLTPQELLGAVSLFDLVCGTDRATFVTRVLDRLDDFVAARLGSED